MSVRSPGPPPSPFLAVDRAEWVAENELAFAIRDRPGHTLVVPRRVCATWFEASKADSG